MATGLGPRGKQLIRGLAQSVGEANQLDRDVLGGRPLGDLADGTSQDCNENLVPDECDIASGLSEDLNGNGIPSYNFV